MSKKNNKKNKNKNQKGGENVVSASIGMVSNMVGLGMQIFKTAGGIMRMPYDLAKAAPPPPKEAQQNPTPKEKLPTNEINRIPRR